VLQEIGAADLPEQLVINKSDIADPVAIKRLLELHPDAVATSALTGAGIEALGEAVTARLAETAGEITVIIPYDRGDLVGLVHKLGNVSATEHTDSGTLITAQVPNTELHRFAEFVED
jgi:GTP-binding protein HflX